MGVLGAHHILKKAILKPVGKNKYDIKRRGAALISVIE
jgi:hypothetical protein